MTDSTKDLETINKVLQDRLRLEIRGEVREKVMTPLRMYAGYVQYVEIQGVKLDLPSVLRSLEEAINNSLFDWRWPGFVHNVVEEIIRRTRNDACP